MGRAAGGSVDDLSARLDAGADVLLVGVDEAAHRAVCETVLDRDGVAYPLRLCVNSDCDLAPVTRDVTFDHGLGEYDGLSLSQAGIVATESLQTLVPTDADAVDTGVHVCLCGLTAHADPETRRAAFEFLHALLSEVEAHGGGVHVHLLAEPGAVFPELVAPLFDEVLEVRAGPEFRARRWRETDGSWHALT